MRYSRIAVSDDDLVEALKEANGLQINEELPADSTLLNIYGKKEEKLFSARANFDYEASQMAKKCYFNHCKVNFATFLTFCEE